MTQARSEQVDEETTRHYHCISRCVRRAFLCGYDTYSGRDYEHRRQWIVDRLKFLTSVFAIDVPAYAVMANHLHLVLTLLTEVAAAWSSAEVVERYGKVFPMGVANYEGLSETQKAERVAEWRGRLSSLSWMMRALNEWIARRANEEDGCTGRFWQGRFKSEALLDESALLTCM
ncbi:MAG: transposase, partial [Myxococcota bacterium]